MLQNMRIFLHFGSAVSSGKWFGLLLFECEHLTFDFLFVYLLFFELMFSFSLKILFPAVVVVFVDIRKQGNDSKYWCKMFGIMLWMLAVNRGTIDFDPLFCDMFFVEWVMCRINRLLVQHHGSNLELFCDFFFWYFFSRLFIVCFNEQDEVWYSTCFWSSRRSV